MVGLSNKLDELSTGKAYVMPCLTGILLRPSLTESGHACLQIPQSIRQQLMMKAGQKQRGEKKVGFVFTVED